VNSNLSLYIHIPFCASLCDYCDFFSIAKDGVDTSRIDAFLEAVITDINYQINFFDVKDISTVYIGGGTPSVLGKRIGVLLDALNKIPRFSPVEFTVEANPESAAEEFLSVCKGGGVNRISLGVQTFHQSSRGAVCRFGDAGILPERLSLASRFFPDALSVDLITGLPYQNKKIVFDDIKKILDFEPSHISLYSLTVENGTPLETKIKTKKFKLPESEESDLLWLAARDALEERGYRHYEVSNFARNDKKCLHNVRYWRMEGWLGAGPSASGTVINEKTGTAKRFTYTNDIDKYIKDPLIQNANCEELDKNTLIRESLLMGFRYIEGPDNEVFYRRFGFSIDDCIPKTISRWKERGFLEGIKPKKEMLLFLHSFLSDAFMELDAQTQTAPIL